MLQRVMPELMGLKNILVLNDEAHHCYREKPVADTEEELKGAIGRKPRRTPRRRGCGFPGWRRSTASWGLAGSWICQQLRSF